MSRFNIILLATDFSDGSVKAADMAATLAKLTGAKLYVMNVAVPLSQSVSVESTFLARAADIDDINKEISQESERRLQEFVDTCLKDPETGATIPNVEILVSKGALPDETIVAQAQQINADLIVLGTRGRSGLQRVLMGSTAERVVRTSPIPVLTTRE